MTASAVQNAVDYTAHTETEPVKAPPEKATPFTRRETCSNSHTLAAAYVAYIHCEEMLMKIGTLSDMCIHAIVECNPHIGNCSSCYAAA
jgi:hypothetical protein